MRPPSLITNRVPDEFLHALSRYRFCTGLAQLFEQPSQDVILRRLRFLNPRDVVRIDDVGPVAQLG